MSGSPQSPFVWSGGINFTHRVASGDPTDTSVLVWTRAVPSPVAANPSTNPPVAPDQSVPVCVSYEMFSNEAMTGKAVASGQAFTSYDVDFTVKLDATGLHPDTQYWFQFSDCTNPSSKSPVGKTRTISSPNSMLVVHPC